MGTQIEVGLNTAIEGYRDESGELLFRDLPGERITTIHIPDGMSDHEALIASVDALRSHMRRDTKPVWVDGSNKELVKALCQHHGILLKDNKRPADWGNPTEASKMKDGS